MSVCGAVSFAGTDGGFELRLEQAVSGAPVFTLDTRFRKLDAEGPRMEGCERGAKAKKTLASAHDGGTLGGFPAVVDLAGPSGSGRYWDVTLAFQTDAGIRGGCFTETTVAHRWASAAKIPLPWVPLQNDRLVVWRSVPTTHEPLPAVLVPIAYTLEGNSLRVDRAETARHVRQFADAYTGCVGAPSSACSVLIPAGQAMQRWLERDPPAAAPIVVDLETPAELLRRTSPLELSGLTWVPSRRKYLAVSDDTGLPDTPSRGSPRLFELDAKGVVSPTPLVIHGLEKLDDAESLANGPDGTLLLVTSHSLTSKGKSKSERRHLLRLAWKGDELWVVDDVDVLALGLEALVGPGVDIEAVAFHDGQTLLGLKAPLDSQGRARIVAMSTERKVSVWATLQLEVDGVHEGVTDLLRLPSGTWVLAANAPKGAPPDGGGSLWLLDTPGAVPRLWRRFPGLKPEGLSLSDDGQQVVVVFDRGEQKPQWTHLALPK